MPFIKLDDDMIQEILASENPRQTMEELIREAEAEGDPSVVQPTFQDVLRELGRPKPDQESKANN